MTKSSLIDSFRLNDEKEIERLYNSYRDQFVSWAIKTFNCDRDEAVEVYQQAIVIFYENVRSGKLDSIESNCKTYLFAIGKNKFYERLRELSRQNPLESTVMKSELQFEEEKFDHSEEKLRAVEEGLNKLGSPCREILIKYYYNKNSMEEIASLMDYKNGSTVKNLKYKCLQRLKKILQEEKIF